MHASVFLDRACGHWSRATMRILISDRIGYRIDIGRSIVLAGASCQEANMTSMIPPEVLPTAPQLPASAAIQRRPGLADEVYEAIFAQLMSLRLRRVRASRSTVWRANSTFRRPRSARRSAGSRARGWCVKTHLIGYSAAPQITRRRFDELYELRLLLEPEARAAPPRGMDAEQLAVLQDVAGVMSRRRGRRTTASAIPPSPGRTRSSTTRSWNSPATN